MLTWQIGETRGKDATGLGRKRRLIHVVAGGIRVKRGQGRLERARDSATRARLATVAIIVDVGAIDALLRFVLIAAF